MEAKRVLIVDDEAPVLTVLKRSLEKLGAGYAVSTAESGLAALEILKRSPVDLVITDYKMAGMDGLELLEHVRAMQPKARTILMTAYGNDKVEAEARRLQAYRYLMKPLGIDEFRSVVRTALDDLAISRPGILILSDEHYKKIMMSLKGLQIDVGARCVVLADVEGNSVARAGNLDGFPLEQITPLLSSCIAGLNQAGQAIDGAEDTINLIYRESAGGNLYIINIGTQLLLIIVIDRGSYNPKLGTVWYAAQQVASMLLLNLVQREYANPVGFFGQELEKAVGNELDRLLQTSATKPEAAGASQGRITAASPADNGRAGTMVPGPSHGTRTGGKG